MQKMWVNYINKPFIQDNLSELVPEKKFSHSLPSLWLSSNIFNQFLPLTTAIAYSLFSYRVRPSFARISVQVFFDLSLGLIASTS